jgi:leader peptidase (prepilin peptidase)/N-methyltransferase
MFLLVWYVMLFVLGTVVGSFLNVCIYRIPLEKSLIWPGSRCGHCLQPIRWYDNLPLLSYFLLRGRCRRCGTRFSPRYLLIELLTGVGFAALFHLEVVANVHDFDVLNNQRFYIIYGIIPWQGWVIFGYHAILFSLLVVATFIDLDHLEIPLPVTLTGVVLGLIGSVLLPWPWPDSLRQAWLRTPLAFAPPGAPRLPRQGLYPWPVWNELPAWMPLGGWKAGLATGLAGLLAGMLILRVIAFLFKHGRGKEGLGLGDADLMMMVGCFLGWQAVVVAFFVALLPGLLFGFLHLALRGDQPMPFGPSLALGSLVTWLCWRWLGPGLAHFFFDPLYVGMVGSAGLVLMFVAFWMLGAVRGRDEPEEEESSREEARPPV